MDVGALEVLVLLDPVDEGAVVDDDIHGFCQSLPCCVVNAEVWLCEIANDGTQAAGPGILPYAVSAERLLQTLQRSRDTLGATDVGNDVDVFTLKQVLDNVRTEETSGAGNEDGGLGGRRESRRVSSLVLGIEGPEELV